MLTVELSFARSFCVSVYCVDCKSWLLAHRWFGRVKG